MSTRILKIMRADGGVSLWPINEDVAVADYLAAWETQASPEWLPILGTEEMASDDLPSDKTFRNAWGHDLAVRMDKATTIHLDRLRALRKPLLEALDVEYQRADEADDANAKQVVVAKKQALRDVTKNPAIEAAKTPDELASLTLESLT